MEHSPSDRHEIVPEPEVEPQPHDVRLAMERIIPELAPDADPEDIEAALSVLDGAVDLEESMGNACAVFVMLDVDYDVGLAALGEILQVEAILPNGDQQGGSVKS